MKVADITMLEAYIIENKLGSDSLEYTAMRTATDKVLFFEKFNPKADDIKDFTVQNMVYQVCILIKKGHSVLQSIQQIAGCRTEFYKKLNDEQRILIKNTKANYTSNHPRTKPESNEGMTGLRKDLLSKETIN